MAAKLGTSREPRSDAPRALVVRGLRVALPGGRVVVDDLSVTVGAGEVVVLLGGSGAGKSTFARVLFERAALEDSGFTVLADEIEFDPDELGLVPQRGALFDHLDVRGNLDLALRYARRDGAADDDEPEDWLERVGLARELGAPGTAVARLSGGQAQRVAVARVLAGRRRLLFLDEPSVGLDPHRVRALARLIREQVAALGMSAIVVTHDVALAAGVADRLLLLSTESRRLEPLFADEWPGPLEAPGVDEDTRGAWLVALERELCEHIERGEQRRSGGPSPRGLAARVGARLRDLRDVALAPLAVAALALAHLPRQLLGRPRDFARIARAVTVQALFRPLVFYAVVSVLIGYTVLYVISKVGGAGVRPDALLRQIGGSYAIALAPALSALLFVAASGSATNAWLGSMGLTKQTLALRALGVDTRAYLFSPAWVALGLCYLATAAVFFVGMIAGGLAVCAQHGVSDGWALLTADLLDPRPERVRYTVRAGLLCWIYAWGIASDAVAKGTAPKPDADAVTRGMTAGVVACTLWVVGWELVTVLAVLQ